MPNQRPLLPAALALALLSSCTFPAHAQNTQNAQSPAIPTFRVTSSLVYLDVTVLDKKGNPVVSGLTKDDFHITQDKTPQPIFSFEAPQAHVVNNNSGADNPSGKAPVTILVLDQLNSRFQDFAYIRYEARRYLLRQPEQLPAPAELLVLSDQSLELLQGYTRSRADLIEALDHLPAALPFEQMHPMFVWDRFAQSIDALQQIAIQNRGITGRKNVIWIGHGGPGVFLYVSPDLTEQDVQDLREYAHQTTNMLVDSRVSLFVIYPGLQVNRPSISLSSMDAAEDLGDDDPFAGNINFGLFSNATGGKLYFNRNDLAHLISRSQELGSEYYTLTYQPTFVPANGKFQRIRVTLNNDSYRVVTKAGYFAPDPQMRTNPLFKSMNSIGEASISTVPFNALSLSVNSLVRHADTRRVDINVQLQNQHLNWLPTVNGKNQASLLLAAVARDKNLDVLASRIVNARITSILQDPVARDSIVSHMSISLRFPKHADSIRVVVEDTHGGRTGSVEISRQQVLAAPVEPTPPPQLTPRRPQYVPSSPPPSAPSAPKPSLNPSISP